jgi:hypothetical protein
MIGDLSGVHSRFPLQARVDLFGIELVVGQGSPELSLGQRAVALAQLVEVLAGGPALPRWRMPRSLALIPGAASLRRSRRSHSRMPGRSTTFLTEDVTKADSIRRTAPTY